MGSFKKQLTAFKIWKTRSVQQSRAETNDMRDGMTMRDKIESLEVAKAFFDATSWRGSTDALFHSSLKYGQRRNDSWKYLEKRNKTLQGLYDQIYEEIKCIEEIVKK